MARRRQRDRLYYRDGRGWYADLRDFADVGGKQQAMIPPGKSHPTQDRDEASALVSRRLAEFKDRRERGAGADNPTLRDYARRHLDLKRASRGRAESTITRDAYALERFLQYFSDGVTLRDITVERLGDWQAWRSTQPGRHGKGRTANQSILNELNALGNLFRRAVAEKKAQFNPVHLMVDRPSQITGEATWLEIGEGARVIGEALKLDGEPSGKRRLRCMGPIVATFLLTGGRKTEIFGLELRDIDFDNERVHIRPNVWRNLKRARHKRSVPLWPQLGGILKPYLAGLGRDSGLLFPAPMHGGMLDDVRWQLDKILERAKITKPVSLHTFRHTFAAMRLQTMDNGQPVSPYTVMRELGHSSIGLIEKTYGHYSNVRHRAPVVEYREAEVVDLNQRKRA